jgi:hypothetical protein
MSFPTAQEMKNHWDKEVKDASYYLWTSIAMSAATGGSAIWQACHPKMGVIVLFSAAVAGAAGYRALTQWKARRTARELSRMCDSWVDREKEQELFTQLEGEFRQE